MARKRDDESLWPFRRGTQVRVETVPGEPWGGVVVGMVRNLVLVRTADGRERCAMRRFCREVSR
jgi:hypothetical protein